MKLEVTDEQLFLIIEMTESALTCDMGEDLIREHKELLYSLERQKQLKEEEK